MAERIATHISRDPAIYGGRPCIDGYRIAVHDVAALLKQGRTPDDIAGSYGLSRGQVYAALAYYFDHQGEIDRELAEDEAEIKRLAQGDTSEVAQRIRRALAERRQQPGG
jgi:uncharacterized protein (DUF433 family)